MQDLMVKLNFGAFGQLMVYWLSKGWVKSTNFSPDVNTTPLKKKIGTRNVFSIFFEKNENSIQTALLENEFFSVNNTQLSSILMLVTQTG
jgi:hypothetical protein